MIFVVGNSRSGTTMLGRILNQNSNIHTFHELHFFEHNIDTETINKGAQAHWPEAKNIVLLERLLTSSRDGFFAKVTPGYYAEEAKRILEAAQTDNPLLLYNTFLHWEAKRVGKTIPCEQTPRYLFFVDDILKNYPEAKVIHIVRDPRDIIISQRRKWRMRFSESKTIPLKESIRSWSNYHPYIISKLWSGCMQQGQQFLENPRVKTIRFEDLSKKPEETLQEVSAFLDTPYEESMLNIPLRGSSGGKTDYTKRGIDPSRSQSWQSRPFSRRKGGISKTELLMCEWVAKAELKSMGYELWGTGRFYLRFIPSFALLALKVFLIIPLNLSRTKNLKDTLRRRLMPAKKASLKPVES